MSTPIWLLDVDGVLNAVSKEGDRTAWKDWQKGYAHAGGTEWPILFSPSVTGFIERMHAAGRVEVRWLTTWEDDANGELRELLGFTKEFEVAGRRGFGSSRWWKFDAAQRVRENEPDRPLIWTDDDLGFEREAASWASRHGLGITPQTHLGLTPKHLRMITDFIKERE